MDVVSAIEDCLDDEHRRRSRAWIGEVVHRIRVPGHNDAAEIARFDRNHPKLGKMAYHLVIRPSGLVEQALPFDRVSPHARVYNSGYIGVACIGDFRTEPMRDPQRWALLDVLEWCSMYRGGVVDCFGHTEKPDATSYKGHDCPGVNVDMDAIRAAVAERAMDAIQSGASCEASPFVLTS